MVGDWKEFLSMETDDQMVKKIRRHENTGRPLGHETFVARPEKLLNCSLELIKPGKREEINMVSPEYLLASETDIPPSDSHRSKRFYIA